MTVQTAARPARSLATSFEPNGSWFVFDAQTGRTAKRGFASKRQAAAWISRRNVEAR